MPSALLLFSRAAQYAERGKEPPVRVVHMRFLDFVVRFRVIAGLMAAIGLMWGVLTLGVTIDGDWRAVVVFGPGWLATVGYVVRATCQVTRSVAKTIWFASALVQGAWLAHALGMF